MRCFASPLARGADIDCFRSEASYFKLKINYTYLQRPQSSSASRLAAGAAEFLTLTQSLTRGS
jgi:hypothetical protein